MVSQLSWYWAPVLVVCGAAGSYLALRTGRAELPPGMVAVPAGTLAMGTTGREHADPVHRVQLSAFQVDVHEVSVRDYEACVKASACTPASQYDHCNAGAARALHPVNCVDWRQADAYCRWQSKRLLSEEEWEYAARGSQAAAYPWGSAPPAAQPCWRRDDKQGTCPIGSHRQDVSHFGVLDMAGNVAEWTASGFSESYDQPRDHYLRVTRGGDYRATEPHEIDAIQRKSSLYDEGDSTLGIRCARSVD